MALDTAHAGEHATPRDPVADLNRIAFLLERDDESTYRVRAFRTAAAALAQMTIGEIARHFHAGTLASIKGVGEVTATCAAESLAGQIPAYLQKLEAHEPEPVALAAQAIRQALRGDCHAHTDWSDGGSPIEDMAWAAQDLGHDYLTITDHSPRLTIAHGLSAQRLTWQLGIIAEINENFAAENTSFRLLTGIEVDILTDGGLDQEPDLLAQLDIVVASVHSNLRDDSATMTPRMLKAIRNPATTVLGHCTGRRRLGKRQRPESTFDARAVFEACAEHQVAVEINCRADRLDPPMRLLEQAIDAGCYFSIDSDAHAPGQLDWQLSGCVRAAKAGLNPERIINTWPKEKLLAWARKIRD